MPETTSLFSILTKIGFFVLATKYTIQFCYEKGLHIIKHAHRALRVIYVKTIEYLIDIQPKSLQKWFDNCPIARTRGHLHQRMSLFCFRDSPRRSGWLSSPTVALSTMPPEGFVCVEVLFCTREGVSGGFCEQKRCLVHTGAIKTRVLGAEAGSSAHE